MTGKAAILKFAKIASQAPSPVSVAAVVSEVVSVAAVALAVAVASADAVVSEEALVAVVVMVVVEEEEATGAVAALLVVDSEVVVAMPLPNRTLPIRSPTTQVLAANLARLSTSAMYGPRHFLLHGVY
jgi:hypothetical protein